MKLIMLSIRPEWVEKILNGEKTIEIRKTMPNCELPAKVYIYCTKDKKYEVAPFRFTDGWKYKKFDDTTHYCRGCTANMGKCINGKVVAEFTLNGIAKFDYEGLRFFDKKETILENSCLTDEELCNYIQDRVGYAWHIDDLKIYDEPKELNEFSIKRAFQSWGYIDE